MRPPRVTFLAALIGLLAGGFAPSASAQVGFNDPFSDPFNLYYGFILPRANAQARQIQPQQRLQMQDAQRQELIFAEREALYDPLSPFAASTFDPFNEEVQPVPQPKVRGLSDLNQPGLGPPGYFSRVMAFPDYPGGQSVSGTRGNFGRMGRGMGTSGPRAGGRGRLGPPAVGPQMPGIGGGAAGGINPMQGLAPNVGGGI